MMKKIMEQTKISKRGKPKTKISKETNKPYKKREKLFRKPDIKKKKKGNLRQRLLRTGFDVEKKKKIRRTLQYILFLKKWKKEISFTKVKILKAFLTKFCQIKARRKTRILIQDQKKISKAIKKARILRLLPFIAKIDLRTSLKKKYRKQYKKRSRKKIYHVLDQRSVEARQAHDSFFGIKNAKKK